MPNIIRIRDLESEYVIDDNIVFPIDKDTYNTNAKKIKLSDIAGYVGSLVYINPDSVPETIGGIDAGTTFPSPGKTMQEMWDLLLYPYQAPAFTFFALSESTLKEIGYSFNNGTFTWLTSNPNNVSGNTIEISGYNMTTLSNQANDYSEYVEFTSSVTRDSSSDVGTRTWNIQGKNTIGGLFYDSYSIRWDWKWYYGTSANPSLTETQIKALTSNGLYSSYSRTYAFDGGDYKYICFANTYGGPSNFFDLDTGFAVAMYGGYSNTQNGYSYDLVSVTNTYGETVNYRVYRTQNTITDAFSIVVS